MPLTDIAIKRYTALLSQSGTNAPIANVLQNTIHGPLEWTRISTGVYQLTSQSKFKLNKTFITGYGDFAPGDSSILIPISDWNTPAVGYINICIDASEPLNKINVLIIDNTLDNIDWSTIAGTSTIPININIYQ